MAFTKMFASSCNPLSAELRSATGARESVSAMISSFAGTWEMVNWNRIIRKRKRWTLIGSSSRCLELKSGTRGLWSVCMWKESPIK